MVNSRLPENSRQQKIMASKLNSDLPEINRVLLLTFLMLRLLSTSLLEFIRSSHSPNRHTAVKEGSLFPLFHPGYTNLPNHRASVLALLQTQLPHGEKRNVFCQLYNTNTPEVLSDQGKERKV